jgi:hypothetical protein
MRLYWSMPLPGPFRVGGPVRGPRSGGLLWWAFIGVWWVPIKWLFIGLCLLVWCCCWVWPRALVRYLQRPR